MVRLSRRAGLPGFGAIEITFLLSPGDDDPIVRLEKLNPTLNPKWKNRYLLKKRQQRK